MATASNANFLGMGSYAETTIERCQPERACSAQCWPHGEVHDFKAETISPFDRIEGLLTRELEFQHGKKAVVPDV